MFGRGKKEVAENPYEIALGDDVAPFVEKFKGLINEILTELSKNIAQAVDTGYKYDEIFVLRYVLSEEGNKKEIIAKIQKALEWRVENRELIKSIVLNAEGTNFVFGVGETQIKTFEAIREKICQGILPLAGELKVPVTVNRSFYTMQKQLLKEQAPENLILYSVLQSEGNFKLIEQRTRETGRFIQLVQFVDFKNYMPTNKEADPKFMKTIGQAGDYSDFLHPMQTAKRIGVNISTALSMIMGAAKTIMSRGDDMVTIKATSKPLLPLIIEKYPKLTELQIEAVLPPFLGGTTPCPASLKREATD